jgi:hypothetical protein
MLLTADIAVVKHRGFEFLTSNRPSAAKASRRVLRS